MRILNEKTWMNDKIINENNFKALFNKLFQTLIHITITYHNELNILPPPTLQKRYVFFERPLS